MSLDLEITTPPGSGDALAVLSIADLKKHIRVVNTLQDDVIEATIRDTVDFLGGRSGILNRTILPTTYRLYMPAFPTSSLVELPLPPLQSVTSITYRDAAGATQTFSSANYIVRPQTLLGQIEKLADVDWPATQSGHPRAVTIEFVAGYAGVVPPAMKRLVKMVAAHWYENREITLAEARVVMVNRAVQYGFDYLFSALAVPLSYGGDD